MKRKIIQLAGKTHVVSLPSGFVKKYGLKKGEEIEVEERGANLLISPNKETAVKKVTVDLQNINERVLRWLLASLHKSGHDEIELIYANPRTVRVIQELIKDLFTGFAIMEQTEKRIVLKSVARDLPEEFDAMLRRAFLVTISMGESIIELMQKNRLKNLKDLVALEHTNNQLTNFCERTLNKRGHRDYRKTCFMYVVVWNLEKICDDYKYICEYLSDKQIKIDRDILSLFKSANNLLRGYYELLFKFDMQRLIELSEEKEAISENIE